MPALEIQKIKIASLRDVVFAVFTLPKCDKLFKWTKIIGVRIQWAASIFPLYDFPRIAIRQALVHLDLLNKLHFKYICSLKISNHTKAIEAPYFP